MRFLLTAEDGCPRYALRLMEIELEGFTSYHYHLEKHEVFYLRKGIIIDKNKVEVSIYVGDSLYIPSKEYHQIKNTGKGILRMICAVPIFAGKLGKDTTPCE